MLAVGLPLRAAQKEEPLAGKVNKAIDRGVQYLRAVENGNGHWEVDGGQSAGRRGGWTSLALLALLKAGVKPDDAIIDRGLTFLRTIAPQHTYVVGLQTMVFTAAGRNQDCDLIQRNVDWLVESAFDQKGAFNGWSYGYKRGFAGSADNSNTHYAVLGLHAGRRAGVKIDRKVWIAIRDYYSQTQSADGGWGYAPHFNNGSTLTMTVAGASALLMAEMALNRGREVLEMDGAARNCGQFPDSKPVSRAFEWIDQKFTVRYPQAIYYNLYGLEHVGSLSRQRFRGTHDWYREGSEFLVNEQKADGHWFPGGGHDSYRVVATSFALLFLSQGRAPVLITKLVHGPGDDWNNDHHDAGHLVDYASRELFKSQPLAWQVFDAGRRLVAGNRDEIVALAEDLRATPIAYFNGHKAPRFTEAEEALLKEYLDKGGFLLAEACCGRREFDEGFRALMTRLIPDQRLKPLPADHPIWKAHAQVKPGEWKLEGLEVGGKTVVVYSPQDLSCLWESNQFNKDRGQLAFRLGANIIAHATGMKMPRPR
jgi:hypothetical protein